MRKTDRATTEKVRKIRHTTTGIEPALERIASDLKAKGYCRSIWFATTDASISLVIPAVLQSELAKLDPDWKLSMSCCTNEAGKTDEMD